MRWWSFNESDAIIEYYMEYTIGYMYINGELMQTFGRKSTYYTLEK